VASEIQQDPNYVSDGQSAAILTLRLINNSDESIGLLLSQDMGEGTFHLIDRARFDIFGDRYGAPIQYCPPSDTIYLFLSSATEHPRYVKDEEVERLFSGKLYYWPDPKYLKSGVIGDSVEIKKVANFHSATCPSGKPFYRNLYPSKSK
jgi:hypothetical protein